MALMQALLKIKAAVEGSGAVDALGRSIGGLGSAAGKVTGGLKGLAGSAGALTGAMGSLVPLLSAAGLAGLAKGAIDAGNKMYDLSQRTGVSVEMLAKFKKAAGLSGTTLEAVTGGLMRLSKAMAAAASASDFGGKTKEEMEKAKDAVEEGEKEQTRIVKAQADERVKKLEDESDERLKELNKRYRREEQLLNDQFDDQSDAAEQAADNRTESQIKAIQREYSQRKKAIQSNEALSDAEREKGLNLLEDSEDRALDIIRNNAADEGKVRKRAARDQQQAITDRLAEQKAAEEKAIRERIEGQKAIIKDGADNQIENIKKVSAESIKALQANPGDSALSDELDELGLTGKGASEAFRQLGISVKNQDGTLRSSGDVMLDVANKFKGMKDGTEKTALAMKLFGKAGAELVPMLNMGGGAIESLSVKMNAAFAEKANLYADKMTTLGGKVGGLGADIAIKLLPYLEALTDNLIKGFDAFRSLDPNVQGLIITVGTLSIAFLVLAPAISAVISILGVLGGALAGLKIGATIAGWAALAGPAITAISAAFTGFMAFLTGTLLPGLLTFFSGPVGWTVLAVAAVVAMAIAFREPIMQFFGWLGGAISTAFSGLMRLLQPIFVQPFIDLWNNVLRGPVTAMFDWIGGYVRASMKTALALAELVFVKPWVNLWNVVLRKPVTTMIGWLQTAWKGITKFFSDNVTTPISKAWTALNELLPNAMKKTGEFVQSVWTGIINNIKGVFRGMLNFVVSGINTAVDAINYLIRGYNSIPLVSPVPTLDRLSVPAFAEGGVVDRPTLALVGDGNEREFIIPQSKMAAASANFLSGARGGAVIPQASGGGNGGGNAQISITTGPVLQQGGEKYVTLYDLERAMQMTADGVYKSLRTSAGRYAVGTR